jgi:hypothetical protein
MNDPEARGLRVGRGGLLTLTVAVAALAACARTAATGHLELPTRGIDGEICSDEGDIGRAGGGGSELAANPWLGRTALSEVALTSEGSCPRRGGLERLASGLGTPRSAREGVGGVARPAMERAIPMPLDDDPYVGSPPAPTAVPRDSATIAVKQLMMQQADAERATDLSPPEPDFRGSRGSLGPSLEGASSEAEIDVVGYLAREHARIKTCYELGLAQDPSIAGKVTVRFRVTRRGKIKRARVVHSELPRAVERCILHTLEQLALPAQIDPSVVFEYPFFFGI